MFYIEFNFTTKNALKKSAFVIDTKIKLAYSNNQLGVANQYL